MQFIDHITLTADFPAASSSFYKTFFQPRHLKEYTISKITSVAKANAQIIASVS